jgi:hydrogenase maturation protein HypF
MKVLVRGVVQGVGFRPTVYRIATSMGLNGWVQNNGADVIIAIDRDAEEFVRRLRAELPPLARLDSVEIVDEEVVAEGFRIVPSSSGQRGVGIPNDSAICDDCLREMFTPGQRRYLYPFTNCTNCGARFTIIEDMPYDRAETSMRDFPMCPDCRNEYDDPMARRFHHQTISCPRCGPEYYLLDRNGRRIDVDDPIAFFAEQMERGAIGVAKSWGGMHICCSLPTLPRLRKWYHRDQKPFAVMVRDMDAVRRYGRPDEHEVELLTSPHRPVVLVPRTDEPVNEMISPGLGNVGLFLPYTEMQHILFRHLKSDALVMTSANTPGDPMVLRDSDALDLNAELYLLHNREILNRCDDSVVRSFGRNTFFLRKSRGHIPSPIEVRLKGQAVGVGAQENLTGAVIKDGRLFTTQHIGDGDSPRVVDFLEASIGHFRRLLGVSELDAVGMDMHPGYTNRRMAKEMAYRAGAELVEVQHHWAHAAALLVDAGLDEMVCLTLDGTGYGADGQAWGGEVLHATLDEYDRVAHLEGFPLLGGEMAVKDPRRLVFALSAKAGLPLPYFEDRDAAVLLKLMDRSVTTTGFGRVLDAVSCYLGICQTRTYDGEPAMKLEPFLERGRRSIPMKAEVRSGVVGTVDLFRQLVGSSGTREDRAYSFTAALLEALVDAAVDDASATGVDRIGLTGGVSYNSTICAMAKTMVEERGLVFVCPDRLPNGDGCVSSGQAAVALRKVGK